MAKYISVDLRERVVAAAEGGIRHREVAERFKVSAASVSRWRTLKREKNSLEPGKSGGEVRPHRIDAYKDRILGWVEAEKDVTLVEIGERLEREVGYKPAPPIVHRFFKRLGITRKKKRFSRPSKSART